MILQNIGVGAVADDGTGDNPRAGALKINANNALIAAALSGDVAGAAISGTEKLLGLDGTINKAWLASQLATYIIAQIVGTAPAMLDKLDEIAAALGNDPNFATTILGQLAAKQPLDAELTALAGLTSAANKMPYFTGSGTASLADISPVARGLIDDTTLAEMRSTLELGGAAVLNVGTATGTVAAGNDSRITGAGQLTGSNQVWTQRNTFGALTVASSSTTYNFGGISPVIQVHGGSNSNTTVGIARWSADTACGVLYLGKSRGSVGSYSAVQSGDFLGQVHVVADDGTALQSSARIDAVATETFSGTARGSAWQFSVTTPGTVSKTIPLYIATGEVRPGTGNAVTLGSPADPWAALYSVRNYYTSTVFDAFGTGSPEGVVTAGIGSTYRRTDGGAGTSFYVKESGAGNTGWVAK